MRPDGLRWTYSFRITLLYIAFFAVAVGLLFGVIYWATSSFMRSQLESAIGTELSSLAHVFAATGSDSAAALIARRIDESDHRMSFYLLQDPAGRRASGNLPPMHPVAGWHELPIPPGWEEDDEEEEDEEGQSTDTLIARGQVLPDGWFLLVGQDTDRYTDFEEFILTAAGSSLAVAFGLALIGGWIMNVGMLRRIAAIDAAGRDIMRGNLSHRIPLRGTGDEFDRLSANLNDMLGRIQMLMEGLRQVSNDIAHDLRTPLTRLRQGLEAARAKAGTAADYRLAVDKAIAETDEILDIFGALLRIAQIEAGTRRASFADVDLSGILQTIAETYAAVAEDHRQHLTSRVSNGISVRGDRQLLTQMFANIVENALRHTPAGTRIDVELKEAPAGPVCTIRDDGPGIPEPERQKVFRRFYRLSSSRATPGSGLGLSLVAAVAELHRIVVETGDNQPGLRVTLLFPRSQRRSDGRCGGCGRSPVGRSAPGSATLPVPLFTRRRGGSQEPYWGRPAGRA
jgi:signal transduction histidine kinase